MSVINSSDGGMLHLQLHGVLISGFKNEYNVLETGYFSACKLKHRNLLTPLGRIELS